MVALDKVPIAFGGTAKSVRDQADLIPAVIAFANDRTAKESERVYAEEMLAAAAAGRPQLVAWIRNAIHSRMHIPYDAFKRLAERRPQHRESFEWQAQRLTRVRLKPVVSFDPDFTLSYELVGVGADEWTRFTAAVIAARGAETDIARCRLATCGKFFQVVRDGRRGKPQTRYCCNRHMLEQHKLNATRRSQNARAKLKAKTRRRSR